MNKFFAILCVLLFAFIIYGINDKSKLEKEYLENEDILVEYALELEAAIEQAQQTIDELTLLIDSLNTLPPVIVKSPVYIDKVVERVVRDTVEVNSSGVRTDTTYQIDFKLLDKYVDSYFETEGITSFKWDYVKNEPYGISSTLLNSRISLNLSTEFTVEDIKDEEQELTIEVLTSSPNVTISHVHNPSIVLDDVHKPRPYRWGFGVIGGYGYSNQGLSPYIGVGITYTFIGLKQ